MASFQKTRNMMNRMFGSNEEEKKQPGAQKGVTPAPAAPVSSSATGTAGKVDFSKMRKSMDRQFNPAYKVDDSYISRFVSDANSFLGSAQTEYGSVDLDNASTLYDSRKKTADDLYHRSYAIRQYLQKNRDSMDRESYNKMLSSLDEFDKSSSSVMQAFYSANQYYSQNKEKESFIRDYLTDPEKAKSRGGYEQTWLREAEDRKILGIEDFEANSKYVSTASDGLWEKMWSQYGMGFGDLTYEYINNQNGIRDEINRKSRMYHSDSGTGESSFSEKNYDYMNSDEVSVYNYYYSKYGKKKAEDYLVSIGKRLEDRKNQETNAKVSAFAKAHPTAASVLSVGTSILSAQEYAKDSLNYLADRVRGKADHLGSNEAAMMTNTVRSTVADQVDWTVGNWDAFDFLYHTAMSGADSLAAGMTFGNLGGAVLGLSAAAQGTNDALERGMSDGQAFWNGIFSGVFEGLFETVSIGNFNRLKEVAPNSIKDIFKNLGKSMLVNASEETLTEIANIGYDTLINGEFANYTWEDLKNGAWKKALAQILEAGASGALMGVGMGAAGNAVGYANGNRDAKQHYGDSQQELVGEALALTPEDTFAQKMQGRLDDGKNLSGSQLSRLVQQNDAAMVRQDAERIRNAAVKRLTELGETADIPVLADALTKQAQYQSAYQEAVRQSVRMGATEAQAREAADKTVKNPLSDAEKRVISDSRYGMRLANEMNPSNIREGKHASAWAESIGTNRINTEEYSRLAEAAQLPQDTEMLPVTRIAMEDTKAAQAHTAAPMEAPAATVRENRTVSKEETVPADDQQVPGKLTAKEALQVDEESSEVVDQENIGSVSFEAATQKHVAQAETEDSELSSQPETAAASYRQVQQPEMGKEVAAAAGEGVTRQISTGKAVETKKIVAIRNKQAVIQTADGEISSEDIVFGSKDEDLLWRSVTGFQGITPKSANGIIRAYRSGTPVATYLHGAAQEFRNGYHNLESGGEYADKLTPFQREIIYSLGQKAAGEQIAKEVSAVSRQKSAGNNTGKVYFDKGAGQVADFREYAKETGLKLEPVQETAVATMEKLSAALGVDFYVYQSYEKDGRRVYIDENGMERSAPSGMYYSDGRICIDLFAGNTGKGTMLYTIAHELTHFIRQWSPDKFKILANFLVKVYGKEGISVNTLVEAQIAKAKRNGREISWEEAYEEMVADSMEAMLTDGNAVQFMADLKQEDQTLWQKICQWFRKLAEDLKAVVEAYRGYKPDSNEGRMVAEMQDVLSVLESLYADALVDAGENYRGASDGQKNTTQEGGEKYSQRYLAAEANTEILEMITRVIDGDFSSNSKVYLGVVPDGVANTILEITGIDVQGFNMAIEARMVEHILKGHGKTGDADHSMQNPNHLARIQYVLFHADDIRDAGRTSAYTHFKNGRSRPAPTVLYEKSIGEKSYYVVQAVPDTKAKTLYVVSAFIGPEGYKKEASQLINAQGPDATANTDSVVASKNSIRNTEADVKEKLSDRDPAAAKANKVLERENMKLKEDVAQLKALLKLQRQVTGGTVFTKTSIEKTARMLMKENGVKGNAEELAGHLEVLYSYISKNEEVSWEGIREAAESAVSWLQSHTTVQRDGYAAEILKQLQGSRFYLDESQKQEAISAFGSYNDFRKQLMGTVTVTDKAEMSLDSLWKELSEAYPYIFHADTSSGDMPGAFAEAVGKLRNMRDGSQIYDMRMAEQELLRQVYDSYWRVSSLRTVADVKQREINALKSRHYERMRTLKEYHREQTEQMKLEHQEDLRQVRSAMRAQADRQQQELIERYQEAKERSAERRSKTEMRRKIRKTVMELDRLLNKGDKKRHVKEGMRDLVTSSLKAADILFTDEYSNRDMLRNGVGVPIREAEENTFREAQALLEQIESMGFTENMEFPSEVDARAYMDKLDQQLTSKMAKLKDLFAEERKRIYGAQVSEVLGNLAEAYRSLGEAEDGAIRAAKDENVYEHLKQLQKEVGDVTVKDMNLSQLEAVSDAFTMVLTTVRNANKMFATNLKFRRDVLAGMAMDEVQKAGEKRGKLFREGRDIKDSFFWNNLKPVYAFERLGSETLKTLYGNIRKGQDTWAVDMQEAGAFRREISKRHGWKKWDREKRYNFTSSSGAEFQLNLEQIMSLYAYSRREQALDHLLKGGFVFSGNTEVIVRKNGIKQRFLQKDATAYNLTMEELGKIVRTLTPEQKAFVEEMQTYLSKDMGGKGNEVSMALYGIKSFGEENYFPIRSAGQYLEKAKEDSFRKEQGQVSIVNSGFTKSTTPRANNPITLDGFMDVWAEHVNDMSMYHGFALPMEDFRRVYNYSTPNVEEGQSKSVNAAVENAFGKAATAYIDQLYKDLNGGAVSDNRENISKKLVGLHKKAAVFASASVVIQQPSAFVRSFALIDPHYFIGPKVNRQRHKALWEEVKQYAPVAFIKEMGYFDTGMGKSAKDYLQAEEYSGIGEKMAALFKDRDYRDELLGKAPALADEYTWCMIWEAVKRETKAKHKEMDAKSREFLQLAGERFSEVIDKTQVYDSVLSRSANMRSKSMFMNMLTSFLAEPTTSINMLEDALRKGRKGNKKYFARTLGAVYGSVLLNSMLVSVVYAMRDDDEDETFWEKYLSSLSTEILDGINPITYYPFLRDVWSALQGYDIERADMSLIADLSNAVNNALRELSKDTEGMDEDALDAHMQKVADVLWGLVDSICSLTGLPVKNIRRDIQAGFNVFDTISEDISGRKTTELSLRDRVTADIMDTIPVAGIFYDKSKADRLYNAIVAGDAAYAQRIRDSYGSDSAYRTALRRALRENEPRIRDAAVARASGDIAGYTKIAKAIIAEKHFVQDDVVAAINAEINAMDTSESAAAPKATGLYKADDFAAAVSMGDGATAMAVKADIIQTAQKNGKSAQEAEKSFASAASASCKEKFLEGKLSEEKTVNALVTYCGKTRIAAMADVRYWAFKQEYPDVYADDAWFDKYYAEIADSGISIDLYMNYRNEVKDMTGEGKKARRMEVIDALPITDAQKDALYFAEGWAESELDEAPWH